MLNAPLFPVWAQTRHLTALGDLPHCALMCSSLMAEKIQAGAEDVAQMLECLFCTH